MHHKRVVLGKLLKLKGKNVVNCKWIFAVKYKVDVSIER